MPESRQPVRFRDLPLLVRHALSGYSVSFPLMFIGFFSGRTTATRA